MQRDCSIDRRTRIVTLIVQEDDEKVKSRFAFELLLDHLEQGVLYESIESSYKFLEYCLSKVLAGRWIDGDTAKDR